MHRIPSLLKILASLLCLTPLVACGGAGDGASSLTAEFGLYKTVTFTKSDVEVRLTHGDRYDEAWSKDMTVLSEEELWDYYHAGGTLPVRLEFIMEWSATPNVLGARRVIETVWYSNLRGAFDNPKDEYYNANETNWHDANVRWETDYDASGLLNAPISDGHGRSDIRVNTVIRGREVDWKSFRVNVYRAF